LGQRCTRRPLVGADGIGVARYRQVGRRPRRDRGEDLVHQRL
jgi:hypothetical protein